MEDVGFVVVIVDIKYVLRWVFGEDGIFRLGFIWVLVGIKFLVLVFFY